MNSQRFRLWDLPTRLFHWLLVAAIVAAIVSGQLGGNLIVWHGRIGLLIIGLLVFRLAWGLFGSTYARFAHFFPTPARLKAYLKGEWRQPGHNPLGALAVFALLGLVGLQAVTGLFANDDIAFSGPLADLFGRDLSDRLSGVHQLASKAMFVLIGVHLAAIAFYARVRKDNLVKPMITGWKEGAAGEHARGGSLAGLAVALVLAAGAVYGASGAWLPAPPPPPPAAETPSW